MPQSLGAAAQPLVAATAIPNGDNSGVATLIAGTIAVAFPALTASSRIFLQLKTANTVTLTVQYVATTRVVGTGFTIQANVAAGTINVADVSTLDWFVII